MSFIRFQEMGKIKFENRLLVLQNSHTYSAQKLGHTYSVLKLQENTKKPQQNHFYCGFVVVPPGIEPGTQGFSVLCSTN